MVPAIRKHFNETFTPAKYQAFLTDLNSKHPGGIEFRVAETPVFVNKFVQAVIPGIQTCTVVACHIVIHRNVSFARLTGEQLKER